MLMMMMTSTCFALYQYDSRSCCFLFCYVFVSGLDSRVDHDRAAVFNPETLHPLTNFMAWDHADAVQVPEDSDETSAATPGDAGSLPFVFHTTTSHNCFSYSSYDTYYEFICSCSSRS